ncbi:MAG: hypothetical protein WAK93_11760, partial [Solirubrobacteraceae bacterium]
MAGVVVVIAAIFAALIGSGMAARIGQTLASSIESVVGGGASSSHTLHWGASPGRSGSTSTLPGAPGATSTPPSSAAPPANLQVAPLTN